MLNDEVEIFLDTVTFVTPNKGWIRLDDNSVQTAHGLNVTINGASKQVAISQKNLATKEDFLCSAVGLGHKKSILDFFLNFFME